MITPTAAQQRNEGTGRAREAASLIGLAGSPAFAIMAWAAATEAPRIAVCSSASGMPPINGMVWMYLLMSVFHVSPWLKLACDHARLITHPTQQN
jgi:hypothetical protein